VGKRKRATKLNTDNRQVTPGMLPGVVVSTMAMNVSAFPLNVVEAAGISAVRRCVTLICNAIAGQDWTEWDDKELIPTPANIVKRPAAMMTRREWCWRVISGMALNDIQYLYMTGGVDDEGIPGSLIPMPKEAIQPAGYADPYGIYPPTQYTISGKPGVVSSEFVIPVRSAFWPGVPPHLIGILQMARQLMLAAYASDIYQSRYWQAGGSPTTVITTDQELTDTQATDFAGRWQKRRAMGPDYPAVLGKGAHAEPWGADIMNATAAEARREISVEIANLFGLPTRYLNIVPTGNSMTYANLNDEALSLERFTLSGFVDAIQDVITDLLPEGRRMVIDMTKLTRAGHEARFRAWQTALGGKPFMLPSEVREYEGMPPNDGVDRIETAQVVGAEAAAESFANRASEGNTSQNSDNSEREPVNAEA
jgi:phage portal protein BeeE